LFAPKTTGKNIIVRVQPEEASVNRFLLVIIALTVPTGANAATWYVSNAGTDSYTCTQAQSPSTPKRTINAALACVGFDAGAGAGQTVQVANGTYDEHIYPWPSGTAGNPFTLISANRYGAIIAPTSGPIDFNIVTFDSGADYVVMDGFVIDAAGVASGAVAFSDGSDYATLQNSEVKNVRSCETQPCVIWLSPSAILTVGNSHARILNNLIHDIGLVPYDTMRNHGIYVNGANAIIEGNTIYNLTGFGIHIWTSHPFMPDNNIVRNNRIYDHSLRNPSAGILMDVGSGNVAYNNIIYSRSTNPNAVGITVRGNNQALNNTVYNNGYVGLEVTSGAVARNNIAFKNGTDILTGGNVVMSSNLTVDPGFVSASSFDFRLQAASPAIDAGVTVNYVESDITGMRRPQGGSFDVGAYEYGAGSALPSAPTNVRIVNP
jgi:hypothetical protein